MTYEVGRRLVGGEWVTNVADESGGGGSQPYSLPAVVVETGVNLSLTGAATVDGLVLEDGMVVLAVVQDDATENGLWTVNTVGAWTRPSFFADGSEIPPGTVAVVSQAGPSHGNSLWTVYNGDEYDQSIIVGTSAVNATALLGGILAVVTETGFLQFVYGNISLQGGTLIGLPTADPHVDGALWNDTGEVAISTG